MESAFIIGVLCVMNLCLLCLWHRDKKKMHIMEKNHALHKLYGESYLELLDRVRKNQHDFNNHLQAIVGLCYSANNLKELMEKQTEYASYLKEKNADYKLLISSWSLMVGFLNNKFNQISRKNIVLKYEVDISRKISHIPEYIMIEIVGILIDNAVEAVDDLQQPEISFEMTEQKEKVQIGVSNSISSSAVDRWSYYLENGCSAKEGHSGFGLNKIKEYSVAYNFILDVKILNIDDKNYFVVVIDI